MMGRALLGGTLLLAGLVGYGSVGHGLAADGAAPVLDEIYHHLRAHYAEAHTPQHPSALPGLLGAMDPHTRWLTPAQLDAHRADARRPAAVRVQRHPGAIAQLSLGGFRPQTAAQLRAAYQALPTVRGVILDLRDDPGGLITEAIDVADLFLPGGPAMHTQGRTHHRIWRTQPDVLIDVPTVVLVNGGTASAAEWVASALQSRGRAVLIGTPSYGKGSVQTVFELSDGSGLKLTVARAYALGGAPIDAIGLRPDPPLHIRPSAQAGDPALARALRWLQDAPMQEETP
jgi:C-terminal processing protease CtpA/Prc